MQTWLPVCHYKTALSRLGACGTSDFSGSWQGVPSIRSWENVLWKLAYALKQVQTSLNMLRNSPIVCSLFVFSRAQSLSRSFFERLAMQEGQSWQCMLPELCFNGGPFLTWSLWHLSLLRVLTGCAINQVLRGHALKTCLCFETSPDKSKYANSLLPLCLQPSSKFEQKFLWETCNARRPVLTVHAAWIVL
jgi:hypothetical protein